MSSIQWVGQSQETEEDTGVGGGGGAVYLLTLLIPVNTLGTFKVMNKLMPPLL